VDDPTLLKLFDSCELPYDTWCHRLHVRVAYLFLRRHPFDEALRRFRAGLRAYNLAHEVPEGLTSGYHETLTVAWLHLISTRANDAPTTLDSNSFCNMHPELLEKTFLRKFYSTEQIVSQEAKREFVEPDLQALPRNV
jgi:hypothetical protein